jgi:hypothetical protein
MKKAGHMARMGEMRSADTILVGKPEEKKPLGDLGLDGRIILKCILENRVGGCELELCSSG